MAHPRPTPPALYLPESSHRSEDEARLEKGKVPGDINFKTKGEIALEIIDTGIAAGLPTWAVACRAPVMPGLQPTSSPLGGAGPDPHPFRMLQPGSQVLLLAVL